MGKYRMGSPILNSWHNKEVQQITFVVTQECNLRCKYCYMIDKNNNNEMTFETAKKIVDYFIDNGDEFLERDYIVLDFIGGEPLLKIDLIDKIVDYFKLTSYIKKSRFFGKYRVNMSSNGVLYNSEKVQNFYKKNKNMLSIGISIDGTKEKHDIQRVFPDGSGSYDIVVNNMKLLLSQMPESSTKVTIGHDDLPYLKDSILHLWSLGLNNIPANVVFENVWEKDDPQLFEDQLKQLADFAISNDLWNEYNCTLFSENVGMKNDPSTYMSAVCGTGRMFAIDADGDIYSCVRFMKYSLSDASKKPRAYGNIFEGIDFDKMRPFKTLFTKYITKQQCYDCPISMECTYCAGYNYDEALTDTLYSRSYYICEMHKARVRANKYYWAKLYNKKGITRNTKLRQELFMFFIIAENSVSMCNYNNSSLSQEYMDAPTLIDGLRYARKNFYDVCFIHSPTSKNHIDLLLNDAVYGNDLKNELEQTIVQNIEYFNGVTEDKVLYVFDKNNVFTAQSIKSKCIVLVESTDISNLSSYVCHLLDKCDRVNINIKYINNTLDLEIYASQLKQIVKCLIAYCNKSIIKEVNTITDRIFLTSMNNCFAGEKTVTYGLDGKLYLCPAFYYINKSFGDLNIQDDSIIQLTKTKNSPLCDNCDAYQCSRCVYLNKTTTLEYNTPSALQCKTSHLERAISQEYLNHLHENKIFQEYSINQCEYLDPLNKIYVNYPIHKKI